MADAKPEAGADIERGETKQIPFENILNFRDVGKTINEFVGKKLVTEGKVFRSARPDDATFVDRKRLKEEYGIKTIIDLRTVTEHANQVKKRQGDLKTPALVQSNAALAEPSQIPGIDYLNVNINGKGFERSLLWQLSAWSIVKLITLMAFGYRMEAISILGREVMQPRGLVGLGFDSIDHCGPEIADALRAYSTSSNYPILIHCTQGKDRTGLVIALVLLLLSVPVPAITDDYCMSEGELEPERESRLQEIRSIGLTEDFAGCPADWIEKIEGHLNEKYGGVRGYCRSIGFSEKDEECLLAILRA
ncbi:tyrosine/serine protein phosphatase-like protein [Stipitochalara longipes BDJ]|nr:tyrosine/serine protein phosphatase-like protein [Stipitochalara longipes BDJ]